MRKGNGKSEVDVERLEADHELPPADENEENPASARAETAAPAATTEEEIKNLKAERDVLYDRLARMQAEFENARRRAAREQSEFREYAAADVVKAMLPALDSLDEALKAHAGDESFRGIELVSKQIHDTLAKLGVRPIPAVGEPFDPNLHQAVQMVETTEAEDNHVLEELQRGYKFKDRLLRPAMVRVARNSRP